MRIDDTPYSSGQKNMPERIAQKLINLMANS